MSRNIWFFLNIYTVHLHTTPNGINILLSFVDTKCVLREYMQDACVQQICLHVKKSSRKQSNFLTDSYVEFENLQASIV